jgi:hypothetical protein
LIVPRYRVADSLIPGAGKGLFLDEPVERGAVICAPDKIDRMMPLAQLETYPKDSIENVSSARWFEDWFTISVDWPDECYVNHSSDPTGLWHLGFVFAARDLPAGTEITADYRFILGSGEVSAFHDSLTGESIVGLQWRDNLRESAKRLLEIL